MVVFPLITAYLYRLGGGDIWPFKRGYKWVRRYLLPLSVVLYTQSMYSIVPMLLFSLICHFNLDEIEERDWDDVCCYGLAQAFCFYYIAGFNSIAVASSWVFGTLWSNNGPKKLPWHWVEFLHGLIIGLVVILGLAYYRSSTGF